MVPAVGYLMALSSSFQTRVVTNLLNDLSVNVNAEISVKSAKVKFFNNLQLDDLLVRDQQNDTLLFVPKLVLEIDSFSLSRKTLAVESAKIYSPKIQLTQDTAGVFNFRFLIDSLKRSNPAKPRWTIDLQKVLIGNGDILLDMSKNATTRFHYPFRFKETALTTHIEHLSRDSVNLNIALLKFAEERGIQLNSMSAEVHYQPNLIDLTGVKFKTNESSLSMTELFLSLDSGMTVEKIGKAQFLIDVEELVLDPSEVKLYHSFLSKFTEKINFSGAIGGKIDNFKGDDLNLSLENTADLLFNLEVDGLSNIKEAFYYTEFRKLYINTLKVPLFYQKLSGKPFPLNNELSKLGNLFYQGVVTGFYGDLVTFGTFSTDLGFLRTDLSVKKSVTTQKLELSGNLATEDFYLGAFFNYNEMVGNVTMNLELEGDKPENEPFSLYINGAVDSLEFNNYTYTNVFLRGLFGTKNFNGGINIQDPNLSLMFTGRIDFSNELPIYDFVADVYHAYPSNLNFYDAFDNDKLQMRVKTRLKGKNIDNLSGFVGLAEIKYNNMNGGLQMGNASLSFTPWENESEIAFNSDLLDITLKGRYNIGQLKKSIASIVKPYVPAVANQAGFVPADEPLNVFDYSVRVRDFSQFARVLELPLSVKSDGYIEGKVNDETNQLAMDVHIPDMTFEGFDFKNFFVKVSNKQGRPLSAVMNAEQIFLGKKKIENVVTRLTAVGDSIATKTTWLNNQDNQFMGDISINARFSDSIKNNLITNVLIKPSTIIVSDTVWNFYDAMLDVDSSGILINNFKLGDGQRFVEAHGKLSRLKSDSLKIALKNIDMKYLSNFLNIKKLYLDGEVEADAVIYSGLKRPIISTDIEIKDFHINNTYADRLSLKSDWDNDKGLMRLKLRNKKGSLDQIKMEGTFNPSNKDVDMFFNLNKCRIEYIQPYLESVVQDLKGTVTGPMHVYGKGLDLDLVGDLVTRNGTLNVDYLKTTYFIKDTIHFEEDNISFSKFRIGDRDGNMAYLNGNIRHNTFKNFNYNLLIDFSNCLVMDTKERDNDLFYGTVYATGVAGISGKGSKVVMDVSGRTEPNTFFKLPLSSGEVAGESDFVRFVNPNKTKEEIEQQVFQSRDGTSGLTLNLEVEATPDAYAEIIFDSRVGDVIKGRGTGTLAFKYDTYEDFKMYGEYKVEEGEYLFTLQNIINKRFDIEPGGTITWGGDPYEAIINLDAYYAAKASLNDLMPGIDALDDNKSRRIPVNCHMMLTERLMNPSIKFDIELPTAPQETQQRARNIINNEDEMNKQIFSLLALNSFVTPDYLQAANPISSQSAAMVTTSEFLSNQLSHWLSQISNDFDVGVNYRPSDLLTSREIEVMLSTQIFDDKVSINGNFGYREAQAVENSSNFVGDFDVDVKLNSTGNLRLKAYTRSNDEIFYDSKTTQAVGFTFKEEFNSWEELMRIYAQRKENRIKKREAKKRQNELDKMNSSESDLSNQE